MKNIKTLILMSLVGMLFFVEFAFGQTSARSLSYRNSDEIAISPYAQAVPNDSYTFIGISHPSLKTSARKIGVVVETVGMTTTQDTPAGRSAVFTVSGGETHRVFVVNQGHKHINSSNAAFTGSKVHLLQTVNTPQFGSIRVSTVDEAPNVIRSYDSIAGTGDDCHTLTHIQTNEGCGWENLAQLSMWGVIYMESSGAGFSMEFIGDMHDSRITPGRHMGPLKPGSRGSTIKATDTARVVGTRPGAGVN